MSCKSSWRGAAFFAALTCFGGAGIANGQIQSGALPDADLWTVGFLPAGETSLPASSWAAADSDELLALTRTARTRNLSPVEQVLMRRLVLSSANAPGGDKSDALLAERARLMFQIGEASAAAQLLPTLKKAPVGLETDEVAVDLQLAIGQTDAACLNGAGEGQTGEFWVKLRAVCFALADNYEEAELAMELASAQDISDAWLSKAIFAASGAIPNKPEARFDSGLSLAISAKAGLEPSVSTIANSRLDLAAAIAQRNIFNPAMRVQVAGVAAEAGLLDGASHRALYKSLVESEDFNPRTPLEVALQTTLTSGSDPSAKARAVRAALRTARGNAARFGAVSRLLMPDVKELPVVPGNARMAMDFASGALATGDVEAAQEWVALGQTADAFQAAWMQGVILLADTGAADDKRIEVAELLMSEAKTAQQKAARARLFILWQAVGIELPPKVRALLARDDSGAVKNVRKPVAPTLRASIAAAGDAGAGAEMVLRAMVMTQGDAYRLAPGDAGALIKSLRTLGQDDVARQLALEATGYWRRSL